MKSVTFTIFSQQNLDDNLLLVLNWTCYEHYFFYLLLIVCYLRFVMKMLFLSLLIFNGKNNILYPIV